MPTPRHTLPLTTLATPPTSHRTTRAPTSCHTLPLATLYRRAILDLYIHTSPRPTSSPPYSTSIYVPHPHLLPHVLTPSSAPRSHPSAHLPAPLPRTLTPSSAPLYHPSTLLSTPLLLTFPPSSAKKFALPRLKQAVTHLWKSFTSKEEEHLSSRSYPADFMWITL